MQQRGLSHTTGRAARASSRSGEPADRRRVPPRATARSTRPIYIAPAVSADGIPRFDIGRNGTVLAHAVVDPLPVISRLLGEMQLRLSRGPRS
jgi:hypothetical protein